MVCSTAILSASLALSLLRHGAPPSQSFVLSPFSLNSALSIVHDGANGTTQEELSNLLLKGCTPSDVTDHYSSLALHLPSNDYTGVAFKSANRFYVDDSISLKVDYQKHVEDKYKVKVQNLNLTRKEEAATEMNKFVDEATDGMINDVVKADGIDDKAKAILINAIHFVGKWKLPFNPTSTRTGTFKGEKGDREIAFMNHYGKTFRASQSIDVETVLILPYQVYFDILIILLIKIPDAQFSFFYLMPNATSSLEKMRSDLTGEKLHKALNGVQESTLDITVPKLKVDSKLDGVEVLNKLGVNSLFESSADLSKISSTKLKVSKITHNALIEVDEEGTKAGASTEVEMVLEMARPEIVIDRPFLFGILDGDNLIFLGQFV